MIESKLIELKYTNDNSQIEYELKQRGIEPLRWAVVKVEPGSIIVSVSYCT